MAKLVVCRSGSGGGAGSGCGSGRNMYYVVVTVVEGNVVAEVLMEVWGSGSGGGGGMKWW